MTGHRMRPGRFIWCNLRKSVFECIGGSERRQNEYQAAMQLRCRLCGQEKPLIDIKCTIKEQQPNIRQMLLDCCRWSAFEGDEYADLTKIVCKTCYASLEQSWQFAKAVANTQQYLLDISNAIGDEESKCVAFDLGTETSLPDAADAEEALSNTADTAAAASNVAGTVASPSTVTETVEVPTKAAAAVKTLSLVIETAVSLSEEAEIASRLFGDTDHFDDDDAHSYVDDHFDRDSLADEPMPANDSIVDFDDGQESEPEAMAADEMLPLRIDDRTYKILDHLRKEECNADGTITLAGVQRLQLLEWSLFQLRCHVCDYQAANGLYLRRHIRYRHPDAPPYTHICILCKKAYPTTGKIYRHLRQSHLRYLQHCCTRCSRFFWDVKALKRHFGSHKKEIVSGSRLCDICGITVPTNPQFELHYRQHIDPKYKRDTSHLRTYECYMCKKKFQKRPGLNAHLYMHGPAKPRFQCHICDAIYNNNAALKRHMTSHTGIYPFNCDECGKGFCSTGSIQVHRRVHTGEKPYACTFCDYRTIDGPNLNKHMKTRHGTAYYKSAAQKSEN